MGIAVAAALLVTAVLLWLKVEITVSVEMRNKNTVCRWQLRLFGGIFKLPRGGKKTAGKTEQKEDEHVNEDIKMSFGEVLQLRDALINIAEAVFEFIQNNLKINKFDTEITVALENPFENGIAYGAVSGGANIIYGLIIGNFKIKNYHLDIYSDFNSGAGLALKFEGSCFVRPVVGMFNLAKTLILNKELRNNINKVKRLFQKEEQ